MRYRSLGDSGLMVSAAGLGCNNFGRRVDLAGTRAVVDAAIDSGITMLDTADIYGDGGASEELLGEVLAGRLADRGRGPRGTGRGHSSLRLHAEPLVAA